MLERRAEEPWTSPVSVIDDQTRTLALGLFVIYVPVTIARHAAPDSAHVGRHFRNIATPGTFLFFRARGPGAYALDGKVQS